MITEVIKTIEEAFRIIKTEIAIKRKDKSIDSQKLITFRSNIGFQRVLKTTNKVNQPMSNKISNLISQT